MNYDLQTCLEHALRTSVEATLAGPPDILKSVLPDERVKAIIAGSLSSVAFAAMGIALYTNEPVRTILLRLGIPENMIIDQMDEFLMEKLRETLDIKGAIH